jgi:hypothetical protein
METAYDLHSSAPIVLRSGGRRKSEMVIHCQARRPSSNTFGTAEEYDAQPATPSPFGSPCLREVRKMAGDRIADAAIDLRKRSIGTCLGCSSRNGTSDVWNARTS